MGRYNRGAEKLVLQREVGVVPNRRLFVGKAKKTNALAKAKPVKEEKLANSSVHRLNAKEYVRKLTPIALKEYEELKNSNAPKANRAEHLEFLKRRVERNGESIDGSIRAWKQIGRTNESFYTLIYGIGLDSLREGEWYDAYYCWAHIAESYYQGELDYKGGGRVSTELGEFSITSLRKLARVWMLAHATELGEMELEPFNEFIGEHRGYEGENVPYTAGLINRIIEKTGNLGDLPIMQVIGSNAGKQLWKVIAQMHPTLLEYVKAYGLRSLEWTNNGKARLDLEILDTLPSR